MMYWLDGAARSNVASRVRTANPILEQCTVRHWLAPARWCSSYIRS